MKWIPWIIAGLLAMALIWLILINRKLTRAMATATEPEAEKEKETIITERQYAKDEEGKPLYQTELSYS